MLMIIVWWNSGSECGFHHHLYVFKACDPSNMGTMMAGCWLGWLTYPFIQDCQNARICTSCESANPVLKQSGLESLELTAVHTISEEIISNYTQFWNTCGKHLGIISWDHSILNVLFVSEEIGITTCGDHFCRGALWDHLDSTKTLGSPEWPPWIGVWPCLKILILIGRMMINQYEPIRWNQRVLYLQRKRSSVCTCNII